MMPSLVETFCNLEHILLPCNIELNSTAVLKLSSSHNVPSLSFPSSVCLPALLSSDAWVTRGNGLRISFMVDSKQLHASVTDRSELAEALGSMLQDAKVRPTSTMMCILLMVWHSYGHSSDCKQH